MRFLRPAAFNFLLALQPSAYGKKQKGLNILCIYTKMELNPTYSRSFRVVRTDTRALKHQATLDSYIADGFLYIRKLHYRYVDILREPTTGSKVELTVLPMVDSVLIDSPKGRKFIRRISYF